MTPNTVAGVGGDVPKFNLMFFKPNTDGAVPSDAPHMFTTTGGPHFETVGGPPPPPPAPPAAPGGIISSRTPGPENLFNHLNLGQLGAMGGGVESVADETNQSPSFQQASNGFPQYPYLHQQPSQEMLTPSSSQVIFTPSSNFIVMTPGVFTTATNAGFTSTVQPLTAQSGAADGGDSLLPIGTERAHKSATLPAAFSMLAPGKFFL